jgi:hypothetical protein
MAKKKRAQIRAARTPKEALKIQGLFEQNKQELVDNLIYRFKDLARPSVSDVLDLIEVAKLNPCNIREPIESILYRFPAKQLDNLFSLFKVNKAFRQAVGYLLKVDLVQLTQMNDAQIEAIAHHLTMEEIAVILGQALVKYPVLDICATRSFILSHLSILMKDVRDTSQNKE